uniref:Sulfate_transp domain-containing protein n=1 Tax=Hydatigena taeniaeformis TaxID=6205 RepID=A0A0R3WTS8_HYDTA
LANVLSNQFDYRPVAMVSALLSSLILVGSAFLKNLRAFALLFGICGVKGQVILQEAVKAQFALDTRGCGSQSASHPVTPYLNPVNGDLVLLC